MKKLFYSILLIAGPILRADSLIGCLDKDQIRVLQKQTASLETELRKALQREITAELEKQDPSFEKENARQLYFKLRKSRAELERSTHTTFCPKDR